jgi:multidrug resistance efflux pump
MLPPPPAPAPARSWFRLSWLVGIALITASLVGASHVLHSRPASEGPADGKVPAERSFGGPAGVVCLGTVEPEAAPGGYVALSPVQPGEVTDVAVTDGQAVKKGDALLKVDDAVAAQALAQAETGVRLAQAQQAQAQQLAGQYQAGIDAQKAAVDAAKHKITAAEYRLKRQKYLLNLSSPMSNQDEINASTEELEAAKLAAAAEEAKLRAVQANKPDAKIREADENVALARQRVEQARLAVKRYVLEAPADGTVLRVSVSRGSVLGPQTRQAPVLFAPAGPLVVRAEVEQEFAHRVQRGMAAVVQDEANGQVTWQGRVKRLGAAYLPKRGAGPESLAMSGSDVRVLECLVELDPNQPAPLLGQRVRVNIGTHGGP